MDNKIFIDPLKMKRWIRDKLQSFEHRDSKTLREELAMLNSINLLIDLLNGINEGKFNVDATFRRE